MDFSSGSSGGFKNKDVESQLRAVQNEINMKLAMEKLQLATDKCFRKCVNKPGSSLESYQQKCLANCTDRYFDAEELVSRSLLNRMQSEAGV
ncbi:hypothetical protein DPMN_043641 [Dreissena polymorpha]|uniref:Mitochondrial import inner membrane translocase subunit n=1 Tax=Dreissena polymorpha TaxID=45954 RepID=A0A9D4HVT0_DREPO|nr:hypothetical protein DPMN_043641 [Dreissena polymorpha]